MAEEVCDPATDGTLEEADDKVNKQLPIRIHQCDNVSNTFNNCNVFLAGGNLAYHDIGQRVLPGLFKNQMDSERQQGALYEIGLKLQEIERTESIAKNERIRYLQTELNNPLKTIGFKNAQALLVELKALKGSSDLDISLKWAECEMRLNQGNEESAIETVWKYFPLSQSASGINRKADKYYRHGHYVGAMLLFKMSFDMGMKENDMPQAKKISAGQRSVVNIKQAVNSLIKEDCKSLEIATNYGLKYMKEIVNALRSIEHAQIDLSELSCLTDITSVLNKIGNYKKTIQDGEEMTTKIDNKFRKMATNYKHYSWLWNNIGSAYNHLERYRKAEECYMKAIKASEEARDYENENKRQQSIKATQENLERVRKSLASQN